MIGLALVLAGVAIVSVSSTAGENISTGGFVLIGPFPIAFGSGTNGPLLSALAVVLGVVMLVMLYITARRIRRGLVEDREEINK